MNLRIWKLRLATYTPLWLLIHQRYEPEVWREISEITGELAVDVGANLGQYTIPLAKKFGRVIAVEPLANNLKILRANLRRCCIHNVEIQERAVADFNGEVKLHQDLNYPVNAAISNNGQPYPVTTLDKLLRNEITVDLVKVDVEGSEWQVFRGADTTMPRIRRWLIEVHDASRADEFDSMLDSRGYKRQWITHSKRLPHVLAYR